MAASSSSSAGGSPAHAPAGGGGGGGPYHHRSRFGDTTLTKVFVGGLAWETPSEGLREHFEGYGEILEAVVIADRETGRSKGYGFVTFREPEAAQRAVQNPNPVIAGRRANCNIASMCPPRAAPPRGRGGGGAGRGPHMPEQQPLGPQYRAPPQMPPAQAAAVFYHPHYGYWCPPDYPFQQVMCQNQIQAQVPAYFSFGNLTETNEYMKTHEQAFYNSQVLHHYYPQLYGPTSPSGPYQYMGYMPGGPGPRTAFSPMQQSTRPPFFQQQGVQMESSFPPGPSLPPNFRFQLPARAVSRQSDDAPGSQSTPATSSSVSISTNNQESSRHVGSNSDPSIPN